LGDLHIKNASKDKAIGCFTQVAEHYGKQGFAQKAIAIYSKILRLKPDSVEIISKLAHLYQIKGSVAEARTHYKTLAANYEKKGQKTEALAIWKKIAEMDSNDSDTYLKIAESCAQEGQFEEAAKAYNQAATRAALLENYEAAITAFSKTLEINPEDTIALSGLVKSQIELGYSDEAAQKLEEALEKQPNNKEMIYLLVDCYMDMNDPSKAEKIIIKLIEQEPANYPKLLELIKIYLKENDTDSATRILSITTENLLAAGQDTEFIAELNEILARNPEQLDALRLLIRYHTWKRNSDELKQALERLAEAAQHQDSPEDEKFALVQLVMIEPQNEGFAERLQEIKASTGDFSETVLPIEEFSGEPNTPVFENFSNEDEDEENNSPQITSFEHFESFYGEEKGFSAYEVAENPSDSNGNGFHVEAKIVEDFAAEDQTADQEQETEFAEHIYENDETDDLSESELKPADELRLQQEVESIEFYISQKYKDLADKSLTFLEEDFGNRPELAELRRQIDNLSPKKQESEAISIVEENFVENEYENAILSESFDDFDEFRSELGLEEPETGSILDDYETHFQLATAYQEMGLMEVAIREFQDAINLVKVNDGTRRFFKCANLLGLCFMECQMPHSALIWYKRALETADLNDGEKQALYYEIGKAYEAEGEIEKALQQFERIYTIDVDYRDVVEHLENLREKIAASAT
jgi:tetratricopeptide (TPR) repeat protein